MAIPIKIIDKWDVDPLSPKGRIVRPYFIPLPKDWENHKHFNTEILEKNIVDFVKSGRL